MTKESFYRANEKQIRQEKERDRERKRKSKKIISHKNFIKKTNRFHGKKIKEYRKPSN